MTRRTYYQHGARSQKSEVRLSGSLYILDLSTLLCASFHASFNLYGISLKALFNLSVASKKTVAVYAGVVHYLLTYNKADNFEKTYR